MKTKFKKSLFGFNKKQIYNYIKKRDIRTAEILDKNKDELERLRKSEELVNSQIKNTFPLSDNPVYLQTEEELKELQEQVAELKKEALALTEFLEENEGTQTEEAKEAV